MADWNLQWSVEGSNLLLIWSELWWIHAHANSINKVTRKASVVLLCFRGVQELHVCNKTMKRKYKWMILKEITCLPSGTDKVWLLVFECAVIYSWATHRLLRSFLHYSSLPRRLLQRSGRQHDSPLTAKFIWSSGVWAELKSCTQIKNIKNTQLMQTNKNYKKHSKHAHK